MLTCCPQRHLCESCSPKSSDSPVSVPKARTSVTNSMRYEKQYPIFKSACLAGASHNGARPKSTKETVNEASKIVETVVSKATAAKLVESAVDKAKKTASSSSEDSATCTKPGSVRYQNDLQKCFRESLKSHSALRRPRRDTPYPVHAGSASNDAVFQQQPVKCLCESLRAAATLQTSEESDIRAFSLTEICQKALNSAAASLGSMYEACINGEMKKARGTEKKASIARKLSLDKAARKIKKPRKFHFKVIDACNIFPPFFGES